MCYTSTNSYYPAHGCGKTSRSLSRSKFPSRSVNYVLLDTPLSCDVLLVRTVFYKFSRVPSSRHFLESTKVRVQSTAKKNAFVIQICSAKLTVCPYEKAILQVFDKDHRTILHSYTLGFAKTIRCGEIFSYIFTGSIEDGPSSHFTCDINPWFLMTGVNVPNTTLRHLRCNWS